MSQADKRRGPLRYPHSVITPTGDLSMAADRYPHLLAPLDLGFTTLRNRT